MKSFYSYQLIPTAMDLLHYYAEYRVLICKSCQHAVYPAHIIAHLRSDQHKLTQWQSQEIADQYKIYDLANPQTEVIAPEGIITPIEHLPIYRDGLQCNYCNYICRKVEVMKKHQRQLHNLKIGRGRRSETTNWALVWCQQFFTGVGWHFFQIQETNQSVISETVLTLLQLVHRQLDQKEKIEQEKRQLVKETDDKTETSPWLERTQWIEHLQGQDKITIVRLVKPAGIEDPDMQEIEKSVVRLVEKARQTVLQKKVSIFTLQRLESFQASQDASKPFQVKLETDTIKRYQRIWQQLLLYILRTADMESRLYRLTQEQQDSIHRVKITATRFQEELEVETLT
jgi:Orsellinic acid/F9775 biosynthesis cluster protein D